MIRLAFIFTALLIAGCSSPPYVVQPQQAMDSDSPRKIAIFFEGTANDEASRTNVGKLHNLVSLQSRSDIQSIYIKGVGTSGFFRKPVGMATGWGIGQDVREAYEFLGSRYNPGDEIYVFGFSRGAYAARIFAGLVELAGVADLRALYQAEGLGGRAGSDAMEEKTQIVKALYRAHKVDTSRKERESRISKVNYKHNRANISFMGLWDTVSSLGVPDYKEKTKVLPNHYFDRLCGVERAAHAVSIDDNRARAFTPVMLTSPVLLTECGEHETRDIHSFVDEVWFPGAHSDVGGGYHDTQIEGVSLNWMLSKIRQYDLVPKSALAYEAPLDKVHNPDKGALGLFYWKQNRYISYYVEDALYPEGKLPVHESLILRLENPEVGKPWFGFNWVNPQNEVYRHCFQRNPESGEFPDCHGKTCTLKLKADQNCFNIIKTKYPQ